MSKARLVVLSVDHRGKTFELTADKYSCGRSPECDICIPDSTLSGHHCNFIRSGGTYILQDNQSTNGTKVNGEPIEEQQLAHADMLTLGTLEALFEAADGEVTIPKAETNIDIKANDMTKTVVCIQSPYVTQKINAYQQSKRHRSLFFIGVGILAVVIAVLVFLLVSRLSGGDPAETPIGVENVLK